MNVFNKEEKMKSILFVALVMLGCINVFAQEKTISKAEFEAVSKNPNRYATLAWKGKSFRNIRTIEVKSEKPKPVDQFLKSKWNLFQILRLNPIGSM